MFWYKYVYSGDTTAVQDEHAAAPASEPPNPPAKRSRRKLRNYQNQAAELIVQNLYIDSSLSSEDDLPCRHSYIIQGTKEHSYRDYSRKDRKALSLRRCASALRTNLMLTDGESRYPPKTSQKATGSRSTADNRKRRWRNAS